MKSLSFGLRLEILWFVVQDGCQNSRRESRRDNKVGQQHDIGAVQHDCVDPRGIAKCANEPSYGAN
jgi:hypothetical protein